MGANIQLLLWQIVCSRQFAVGSLRNIFYFPGDVEEVQMKACQAFLTAHCYRKLPTQFVY
jgi:hypothetical protein